MPGLTRKLHKKQVNLRLFDGKIDAVEHTLSTAIHVSMLDDLQLIKILRATQSKGWFSLATES